MGFFCGSCQPKDKRTKLREMDGDRPSSSASRIWIHPRRMLMYVFFPVMRQTLASLCPPLALQCGICAFIDPCPPKSLYRKWPSSSVVYLLHCQTLSPGGWWEWKMSNKYFNKNAFVHFDSERAEEKTPWIYIRLCKRSQIFKWKSSLSLIHN